jgi:lipoyl(octanoyl) transferase
MNQGRRSPNDLWVCHLGTVPYREALAVQLDIAARRQAGELPDTLLLLEHPPVYTRGRRSRPGELTLGEDFYRARGIEVVPTDRGGRVTYHGPGQLVGYPVMGVTDVIAHLRTAEDAIVAALAEEGLQARSRPQDGPDYTGVWVEDRKIASLGVHVSRGVSTHGFAVNVDNDLEPFSWVVACGLPDVTMTSLAAELEQAGGEAACTRATLSCFRRRVAHHFCAAHGRRQRLVSPQRLGIAGSGTPAPPRGTMPRTHHPGADLRHVDDPLLKQAVPV